MCHVDVLKSVVKLEIDSLNRLFERIDESYVVLSALLSRCRGKIIFTGIGKSGIIALKIASTFNTVGKPAICVHPVEFLHGELGVIHKNDILFVISRSGKTKEILSLIRHLRKRGRHPIPIVGMVGDINSPIGRLLDHGVRIHMIKEADMYNTLPTSSTTVTSVIGDMLCVLVQRMFAHDPALLEALHPEGDSGRRLRKLKNVLK